MEISFDNAQPEIPTQHGHDWKVQSESLLWKCSCSYVTNFDTNIKIEWLQKLRIETKDNEGLHGHLYQLKREQKDKILLYYHTFELIQ